MLLEQVCRKTGGHTSPELAAAWSLTFLLNTHFAWSSQKSLLDSSRRRLTLGFPGTQDRIAMDLVFCGVSFLLHYEGTREVESDLGMEPEHENKNAALQFDLCRWTAAA